jgi:hypothetical protein
MHTDREFISAFKARCGKADTVLLSRSRCLLQICNLLFNGFDFRLQFLQITLHFPQPLLTCGETPMEAKSLLVMMMPVFTSAVMVMSSRFVPFTATLVMTTFMAFTPAPALMIVAVTAATAA